MTTRAMRLGLAAATLVAVASLGCARSARQDQRQDPDVVIFSHQEHVVKQGTACTDCHANVSAEQGLPEKIDAPKMAKCGDCHEVKDAAKCKMCHPDPKNPQTYAEDLAAVLPGGWRMPAT